MTPQSAKDSLLLGSHAGNFGGSRRSAAASLLHSYGGSALFFPPSSFNLARTFSLVALLLLLLPPSCSSLHSKVDKSERRSRGVASVFRLRLYNNAHGSFTAHSFISRRAAAAAAPRVSVTWCYRGAILLFLCPPLLLDFLLFTGLRRGQTDCGARRVFFPYLKCHPSSCVTPQGGRRSESDSSLLLVAQ